MKNKRNYLMILSSLMIGVIFNISCNKDKGNSIDLTGTYGRYIVSSTTVNDRLIFTGNNFSFNKSSGTLLSGTYKYDGAILSITINGVTHKKYASFSEKELIISGEGAYSEYLNSRWVKRQ